MSAKEAARLHWEAYAAAFSQPLQANGLLGRFVTNPDVTGAYGEAWIRSITRQMLGLKFRISTGAVTRSADLARGSLKDVPQCDLIIWDPSEMPGLFETGDFALVPFFSVRAVIEVKRSVSDMSKFEAQLSKQVRLVPSRRALGVVVSHPKPLFDLECTPDWLDQSVADVQMTRLMDSAGVADTNGVMALIYFLAQVAGYENLVAT